MKEKEELSVENNIRHGCSLDSLVGVDLKKPLSAEESAEMMKLEAEYMKEIETNKNAGALPKYKKYWEYVFRWRATNKP